MDYDVTAPQPEFPMSKAAAPRKPATRRTAAKAAPATEPEREPRGARRKRETRAKLLDAAFRLMAERGMDGVAINEITEAADVGFGSFYNHFESKEAIYDALTHSVFEEYAESLAELVKDVDDPAKAVAFSIRLTLGRARREPVWGQFLLREGYSARALTRGLGQFLLRDIMSGIAAKRFKLPDLLMGFLAVGSTALGAIAADGLSGSLRGPQGAQLRKLGLQLDGIPERTAATALTILGLPQKEAETIAYLPLPGAAGR